MTENNPETNAENTVHPASDERFSIFESSKIVRTVDDETEVLEIKKYIGGEHTCDGVPISEANPPAGTCSVCGLPVSNNKGNFDYCDYVHCQAPLGRRHMRFYRDRIYCPKHYPNILIRLYDRFIDMVQPK